MLNWKNREEVLPNVLLITAIVMLLGSLGVMLFVKTPSTAGLSAGKDRSRRQLEKEVAQAKERGEELTAAVRPLMWTGSPDSVTATILARLTTAANERKLKIGAFRPQKTQPFTGLTELPFSVQVSGDYPTVRAFIGLMDAPGTKLALRSVQIALANADNSMVTATLSVSAYLETKPDPQAKTTAPATAPKTGGTNG